MSISMIALLVWSGWTYLLVLAIAVLRVVLTVRGQHRVNAFSPAGDDVSPFSGRLCRAHANCVENLGVAAALLLVAQVTGNSALTDPLAPVLVAARVAQSLVHLWSTRGRAVIVRFAFFATQLVIVAFWIWALGLRALEQP